MASLCGRKCNMGSLVRLLHKEMKMIPSEFDVLLFDKILLFLTLMDELILQVTWFQQ